MHPRLGLALTLTVTASLLTDTRAIAHPGSGIVVTSAGDVYFVDNSPPPPEGTGRETVWKISRDGALTASTTGGGHWLANDAADTFANVDLNRWFQQRISPNLVRVTRSDFRPGLIAADGQPFVFNRDGNLYYAKGNVELTRLTPQGKSSPVLSNMIVQADRLGGIKGIACGPDGTLYLTYPRAVQKITLDGHASMLAEGIEIPGCGHPADPAISGPYLRGLAVGSDGSIYAAASNCRAVLKIAPKGTITKFLNSDPWIPTGVALAGGAVYVLEFDDAPPDRWRPRVRKIAPDGTITVLATINR